MHRHQVCKYASMQVCSMQHKHSTLTKNKVLEYCTLSLDSGLRKKTRTSKVQVLDYLLGEKGSDEKNPN